MSTNTITQPEFRDPQACRIFDATFGALNEADEITGVVVTDDYIHLMEAVQAEVAQRLANARNLKREEERRNAGIDD